MDNHTIAGVVIAVAVIMVGSLFYESDVRARWERAQRRRRRQRAKERENN